MGRLTTHVLDTAYGRPAVGMRIELWRPVSPPEFIKAFTTNEDGRLEGPILSSDELEKGVYELHFFVGNYFRAQNVELADPAFLDVVPVRFAIADPEDHYHVPLLISPYGYSTYRGS